MQNPTLRDLEERYGHAIVLDAARQTILAGGDAPTCNSAQGAAYRQLIYAGNNHGMTLIDPNVKPKNVDANALQLMLDWIKVSLNIK